jgi:hypothetical protein
MKNYLLIISLACSLLFFSVPSFAETDCSENVAGTYIVKESKGEQRLWTFTKGGNILGTSSAQPEFSFSHQQGNWELTGNNEVEAVIMNFGFNKDKSFSYIGRLKTALKFDEKCRTFEGEFVLRKFEHPENPMKPETDTGEPITDTFKGQRISVN